MEITQLSNSFSTGNGGGNFERYVQTVFLLALLVDGFSPILERQIVQLDFQGKRLGYDTDDLIITAAGKDEPKILCQIKHDITITGGSSLFQKVINAAWSDFNQESFRPGIDKIVLATGIIAKDTIFALRYVYEQAISSDDEEDFSARIQQSNYTNEKTRGKFSVLKKALTIANCGNEPSELTIWKFCKSFVLLVFDLDFKSSVNKMLLLSLIERQSSTDTVNAWSRLSTFAGECNQSAACVRLNNMPDDIKELFHVEDLSRLPIGFSQSFIPSELWVQLSLIGGWSEKNQADIKIVEQITGSSYAELKNTLHQFSSSPNPCVFCQHGIWKIRNRVEILRLCEKCFSDQTIERVFLAAKEILENQNKQIDQNGGFPLSIPEIAKFRSSDVLCRNLVKGLCILSNSGLDLTVCSRYICKQCSYELIHNIFSSRDWLGLVNVDGILALIAEIDPEQYLNELENYFRKSDTKWMQLFPKEEELLFSRYSIYEVIRSIEVLAWDEKYLVSCVRCLGEIAAAFQDKDKSKIATDAITYILLPWYPQTLASISKQKNAVRALQVENPEIGWEVIRTLLPGASTTTSRTPKPQYILRGIPEERTISDEAVRDLERFYVSVAVSLTSKDMQKLKDLAQYIYYFNEDSIETYLTEVSGNVCKWSDEEKFPLWNKLSDLKHRILNQRKAVPPKTHLYKMLCATIESMTPRNQFVAYQRLYLSDFDEYLSLENDNVVDRWEKKEEKKKEAILDIYNNQGLTAVQEFGAAVNDQRDVGKKLGMGISTSDMLSVFHAVAAQNLPDTFLYSIIMGFVESNGIHALSVSGLQAFDVELISDVLSHFYLSRDLIEVTRQLLPNQERLFWQKIISPNVIIADVFDIEYVVDRLSEVERTVAAVNMCGHIYGDLPMPAEKLKAMLKKVAITESKEELDSHAVQSLIQRLQNEQKPNIQELSEIELIYLPWLNEFSSVQPRALICRLANDAEFFCELLRLYYKRRHEDASTETTPSISPAWAQRLIQIFFKFRAIPGNDWDGIFHEDIFIDWMKKVKAWSRENDRYEVAMLAIGNGLSYAPVGDDGLLCNQILRETLNEPDNEKIRNGYSIGIYNQRGAYFIDPEGKAEHALAQKYSLAAEKAEEIGYSRYSELLRKISEKYIVEAEQNALRERQDAVVD